MTENINPDADIAKHMTAGKKSKGLVVPADASERNIQPRPNMTAAVADVRRGPKRSSTAPAGNEKAVWTLTPTVYSMASLTDCAEQPPTAPLFPVSPQRLAKTPSALSTVSSAFQPNKMAPAVKHCTHASATSRLGLHFGGAFGRAVYGAVGGDAIVLWPSIFQPG